jgi:hypothetical protein
MTNSIRPVFAASLRAQGEAQTSARRKSSALRGSVIKRRWGDPGGWRQNGRKAGYMNQGDLYRDGTRQRSHSVRSSEEAP